jgi:hypothetical protein
MALDYYERASKDADPKVAQLAKEGVDRIERQLTAGVRGTEVLGARWQRSS